MKKRRDPRSRPCGSESGVKGRGSGKRYPLGFRLKAVRLYVDEGYSLRLISDELGCTSGSVQRWVKAYRAYGEAGLEPKRRAEGAAAAVESLGRIQAFLSDKNKAARDSLEEAGEELLAFFRLEVPATLNQTFLSTNIIENAIKNLRRHIGRVCRWRHESDHPERWIASGLKLAERGFRKVRGYRDLHHLVKALQRKESKEVAA